MAHGVVIWQKEIRMRFDCNVELDLTSSPAK